MPPSTHKRFRPTRRDIYVACFSAACTLLWSQFLATDNLGSLLAHSQDDRHWEVKDAVEPPLAPIPIPPSPTKAVIPPHIPPPMTMPKKKPKKTQLGIMPSTEIIAHGDGWTIFDNLYMFNGTLLVISDEDRGSFPEARMITSTGEFKTPGSSDAT